MSNEKHNATCSICGKKYTVCHSCLEQKTFTPWRVVTDTMEHYKIYCVIHAYTISGNKEQAKKDLERCDLTGLENFNPEIRDVIKKIMAEPKVAKAVSKKIQKEIEFKKIETESIEE